MGEQVDEAQIQALIELHGRMYQKRMRHLFTGNVIMLRSKLEVLLLTYGFEDAKKGLTVLFTHKQCEWIANNHIDIALKAGKWDQHIRPYLNERPGSKGEQSEFGERPEGKGARQVW